MMGRKKTQDERVKISHFSWREYGILMLGMGIMSAGPALMYGGAHDMLTLSKTYILPYFLYWAIVSGAICALTAYVRYRAFDKPMKDLSAAAKRVADGDFSVYIKPPHSENQANYMNVMFQDFNKMVAELGSIETMKNDFIANVSHEIKTPLAIIRNYTTMLEQPDLTAETQREYHEAVIGAVDRLSSLVSNILKLNKLESQQITPPQHGYDLCRQLCDCALHYETLWEQKDIDFEVDIEDRATIYADPELLEIVWNNLLSNALKFTPSGGQITIHQHSDQNEITVRIEDTGCGMNEETMRHIFDKFYQGDTSHSCEGNGLGLALAHRVIERMGGTLSVMSKPGQGSTFTIVLPIHDSLPERG